MGVLSDCASLTEGELVGCDEKPHQLSCGPDLI